MTGTLRHYWVTLHRWLGLTVGVLFCIAGLSGSVLVYYPEIDRSVNPELVTPQSAALARPMVEVLAAAGPIARGRFVHSVFPADKAFPVHRVWLTPSAADQSRMWEVLVDPGSARVLGERQAVPTFELDRRNLVNTVYTLHFNLFAGPIGQTVVGLVGVVLLVSVTSGLVLWWPRGRKWRQALTLKPAARGHRRNVDWHRLTGAYGAVLLAIVAFTGVCLVFPDCVGAVFPEEQAEPSAPGLATVPPIGAPPSADQVMAQARKALPGSRITALWLPGADGPDWYVTLREPSGIGAAGGQASFWIAADSGVITKVKRSDTGSAKTQFFAWLLPLHNGSAFGAGGRLAICIAGLLPSILMLTGFAIYSRKRAARRRHGELKAG
ncbi:MULTISPECIES: PepSY-associated TM helix domain-containing protein [unclassified Sphingomonas]|uniref:PepSY-associated TM helix domain-containing protein n=1 Tax=Novosphingobium rhizosphaerae TaxID=1551649 RepID=UPI0015CA0FEE